MNRFVVPAELAGARADVALAHLSGKSRSAAAAAIAAGQVTCGGAVLSKSALAAAGDTYLWQMPAAAAPTAPLDIVYADADIIVIDKPAGVAAHPSPGWEGPTVGACLAAMGHTLSNFGPAERQGIVHRLDAMTSGLMVTAKSDLAYRELKQAFAERRIDKQYLALVQGYPDPSSGTINAPIARHPRHGDRFAVVYDGREAVTHYSTEDVYPGLTRLSIKLETGRTHQIRVHFSSLKHPLAGDMKYGADPALAKRLELSRQWLHASQLSFSHPADGRRMEFNSLLPADLAHSLQIAETLYD